jgi:hypothetical protein
VKEIPLRMRQNRMLHTCLEGRDSSVPINPLAISIA